MRLTDTVRPQRQTTTSATVTKRLDNADTWLCTGPPMLSGRLITAFLIYIIKPTNTLIYFKLSSSSSALPVMYCKPLQLFMLQSTGYASLFTPTLQLQLFPHYQQGSYRNLIFPGSV